MREVLTFFIRNSKWFVFAILMMVNALLLVRSDPYHQSVYLTSANTVSSTVYGTANNVTSYFNLHADNEDLNRRNAELQQEVLALQGKILDLTEKMGADTLDAFNDIPGQYSFIVAHVISNSVMHPRNYITINKGEADGVKPEMGVIDQNGVVGVINVVGKHNSRVISLLNPLFPLSCKIKGNDSFGSLVWHGDDPRYAILEKLPRHTVFHKGDTIVTSGYSAVFPAGIPVGIIENDNTNHNENFFSLRIRLLADFSHLNNVQIVVNDQSDELRAIEEPEKKLDTNPTMQ